MIHSIKRSPLCFLTPLTYHSKYVGDVLHAKLLALGWPELQEAFHIDTEVLLLLLIEVLHVVLQVINRHQAVLRQPTAFSLYPPQDAGCQPGQERSQGASTMQCQTLVLVYSGSHALPPSTRTGTEGPPKFIHQWDTVCSQAIQDKFSISWLMASPHPGVLKGRKTQGFPMASMFLSGEVIQNPSPGQLLPFLWGLL